MKAVDLPQLIKALNLPAASRVDNRIAKTMLTEHCAPTPADKRLILDAIDSCHWVAALKPTTCAVPAFTSETVEYGELHVLSVRLRDDKRLARLIELVHRAIPYPLILVIDLVDGPFSALSIAHKRRAERELDRFVLASAPVTVTWTSAQPEPCDAAFLASLDLSQLPRGDLFIAYTAWQQRVEALLAGRITGDYSLPPDTEAADNRRAALAAHLELAAQLTKLHTAARRETQMVRRMALNADIKRLDGLRLVAANDL